MSKASEYRECPECHLMFIPYRPYQKFHSDKCRVKNRKGKPSKYIKKRQRKLTCANCKTEFLSNRINARFCSLECQKTFYESIKEPKERRHCLQCGTEFRSAHFSKRYCKPECYAEAAMERRHSAIS